MKLPYSAPLLTSGAFSERSQWSLRSNLSSTYPFIFLALVQSLLTFPQLLILHFSCFFPTFENSWSYLPCQCFRDFFFHLTDKICMTGCGWWNLHFSGFGLHVQYYPYLKLWATTWSDATVWSHFLSLQLFPFPRCQHHCFCLLCIVQTSFRLLMYAW